MADHKNCKFYADCDYRNGVGECPDRCVQHKHKDAVIVVRCKDCRHWSMGYCNHFAYYSYEPMTNEDDFCSYGERREGE